ncbi:MAG: hypothetical protein IIA72_21420 [Proteobacteria bacterium]|nr:hypothetical protein [Pseudomonadota bacterium]
MTETLHHDIDGERAAGESGRFGDVFNPATVAVAGHRHVFDGFVAGPTGPGGAAASTTTRKTRIGRAMFLTSISPRLMPMRTMSSFRLVLYAEGPWL